MPLTLPIDEEIFQEIATRLSGVTGATVVQYRREPGHWTPEHLQICVVKKTPERAPELDYPGNPPALAFRMRVNLRLHTQQSEVDTENNSEIISSFIADVHQTICEPANWWQWDAKAVNTEFESVELINPTGGFDAALYPLKITYRHSEGDPFTVR